MNVYFVVVILFEYLMVIFIKLTENIIKYHMGEYKTMRLIIIHKYVT